MTASEVDRICDVLSRIADSLERIADSKDPSEKTMTCHLCGGVMHRKEGRSGFSDFFGCDNYPNCKGIRRLDGSEIKNKVPQPRQQPTPRPPEPRRRLDDFDFDDSDDIPF